MQKYMVILIEAAFAQCHMVKLGLEQADQKGREKSFLRLDCQCSWMVGLNWCDWCDLAQSVCRPTLVLAVLPYARGPGFNSRSRRDAYPIESVNFHSMC